jgi:hypothetical protein
MRKCEILVRPGEFEAMAVDRGNGRQGVVHCKAPIPLRSNRRAATAARNRDGAAAANPGFGRRGRARSETIGRLPPDWQGPANRQRRRWRRARSVRRPGTDGIPQLHNQFDVARVSLWPDQSGIPCYGECSNTSIGCNGTARPDIGPYCARPKPHLDNWRGRLTTVVRTVPR